MPTKEEYKIVYTRLIDYEPSHFVYNDVIKYFGMVMDLWLYTEGTAKGHIIVVDMEGVTFAHAGRLSPMGLKKYLYYLQEAMPIRLMGLHFVNTNAVMDVILAMMKPFMKKELMNIVRKITIFLLNNMCVFLCECGRGRGRGEEE